MAAFSNLIFAEAASANLPIYQRANLFKSWIPKSIRQVTMGIYTQDLSNEIDDAGLLLSKAAGF